MNEQINKGEIVIYHNQDGNIKIDVRLEDETVWLKQAHLCKLFQKSKSTISEHIKNIFKERELEENSVVRKFRTTAQDGKTYDTQFYNLDVIISVGYRVKSKQGTQFRIWATQRLKEYIIKGFALNDERFKTGNSMNYFNELQERIREIRLSERFFYQKIKDIYTTSIDYDPKYEKTIKFFKIVQNKLLWAISRQTAAELVYRRVDAALPLLGMQSYDKKSDVKMKKSDISDAIKEAIKMLKSEFSIAKVILFGSKARGDHDEYSDIDLLVVASRLLHWKEEKAIIGALFDIGMEYNVIFSPLFTFSDEWEEGIFTEFPVYQEISRDGAVAL